MTTPNLSLPELTEGQDGAETVVNDDLRRIEGWGAQLFLQNLSQVAPPGSPNNGEVWVVGASPTGDFAGQAGNLALRSNGWLFITPREGTMAWNLAATTVVVLSAGTWTAIHTFG